jgi:hypothetical protein
MLQFASLLFLFLASCDAFGSSPDFLVDMRIIDSGTEIATPRMMIKEGEAGSLSISGENSIAVGLIVSSANENEAHIVAEIESGQISMSPELLVVEGEWASVSVGELEFHVRIKRLDAN